MARLQPLTLDDLGSAERAAVEGAQELMGFLANDALTMARNPSLMHAFAALAGVIYGPGSVDPGLKRLIGLITSSAAGCQYCMGHTAFVSQRHGIDERKLSEVWNFETSQEFTEAERAALRVALHAGQSPGAVTDDMFTELGEYFDEAAQLEIVAVIAMFGFLNRWNSTLGTELEALPQAALAKAKTEGV